ncbi:C-type lectin lectoxin-Lio3, partial [Aplysia californica]|uniref:C-type lectin lectoxin-Lio3 n=1 Tax=Aplysia californica TaxID=6500 RepID=A0ABM1ACK1_APLCA
MDILFALTAAAIVVAVSNASPSCPAHVQSVAKSYTTVHKHTCYLFVDKEVYWNTARDACWDLGGEMLAIMDEQTMTFVRDTLNSDKLGWRRSGVWLGARVRSRRWRWTNGERMTYTNWASGQPSNFLSLFSVEDCALMRAGDGWQWHDYVCGSLKFHYNYVCQFPLSKPGDRAGRVATSATSQEEDNGYTSILAIIIGVSAGFLLILLVVFLLVFRHHRNA